MKIRTEAEFIDALNNSFAWRIKDISSLKQFIKQSSGSTQNLHIRSATALCYAHWEGFVKSATQIYLHYVLSKRLKYSDAKNNFLGFGVKAKVNALINTKKYKNADTVLRFILSQRDEKMNFKPEDNVYTGSNLNSEIFSHILFSIGISESHFESKYNFIDEVLLSRRNKVAHGEYLEIDYKDCLAMIDQLEILLRMYKDLIANMGIMQEFRL